MTYNFGKDKIISSEDRDAITDIAFGTTAGYAYEMYLDKQRQIAALEYECELLIDKYHSEMCRASIPMGMYEALIMEMFGKDERKKENARKFFLDKCFTPEFVKTHKIEFSRVEWHGYNRTAAGIVLAIGDYEYTVEIPLPQNIRDEKDKESLMGKVKFRVDRIHKSKLNEFVKEMEPVQMPTYDWQKCFAAIEKKVAEDKKTTKKEVKK